MPRWVARIERPDGGILGGGVLLAPDVVLTAAHLVEPGREYVVRFVVTPDAPGVRATVGAHEYRPHREDTFGDSGDVALLRLATPRPAADTTRLCRRAPREMPVLMYGFPEGADGGLWHGAVVVGVQGGDNRVQLRPQNGELVVPGFSGGGVIDAETDRVIGIVLSVDEGSGSRFSYMSPTDTILGHLRVVERWADGERGHEHRHATHPGTLDEPFATELAAWYRGEGWPVLVTAVQARGDRAWTLERATVLADRELRTRYSTDAFAQGPSETVPPVGGHDLVLHVRGMTVGQVLDRVAARLGLRNDALQPLPEQLGALHVPLTAVLIGVDQAAEPEALVGTLGRLAQRGARLLLVFRRRGDLCKQTAETLVDRPLKDRWSQLRGEIVRTVDELGLALVERRDRVTPGPAPDTARLLDKADTAVRRTRLLREWVDHMSDEEKGPGRADLLFTYEDAVERRRERLEQAIGVLDVRIRRREELLGRVKAAWPLCEARTRADGDRAGEAYRRYEGAASLLRHSPCDLEEAEAAARRFITFCSGMASGTEDAS
ncbi:serine protease [Streptomyces sp. NPDC006739]|uniref:S1 family peptidase n=1 Tax=Streptomyces sp. NPDC006739 TaxID=3364763 RepID=UPI0036A9E2DB